MSRSLAKLIPSLLRKFGPVPDAASTVLHLEQLMKLDIYSDLRQSTAYASLLDDINRQFLTHADESVLKEASAALLHAKSFEELEEVTGEKLGQLQEETVAVLMACVRGRDVAAQRLGDGVVTELINTVRRLEYLASITDIREMLESAPNVTITSKRKGRDTDDSTVGSKVPLGVLLALLNRGTSMDELEEELIVRVLKVLLFYFMWKVKALSEEDPKDIVDVDIDDLQEHRQEMVLALGRIISNRGEGENKADEMDAVRIAATGTLLDIYTLFATLQHRVIVSKGGIANGDISEDGVFGEGLERLVRFSREMPEELQLGALRVFSEAERKFAKCAKKTLEEPTEDEGIDSDGPEDGDERREENEGEEGEEATLLTYEQRLCELTGKIVLAVLGDVVNREKFVKRISRNKARLGKNFAEVVRHLVIVGSDDEDATSHSGKKAGRKGGARGRTVQPVVTMRAGVESEDGHEDEEEIIEDRIVVGRKSHADDNDVHGGDEEGGEGDHEIEDERHGEGGEDDVGEDGQKEKDTSPSLEDEDEEMVDV